MRRRLVTLSIATALVLGCGSVSEPRARPAPHPPVASAPAPEPSAPTDVAPTGTWPLIHAQSEGVWSLASVAPDAVVMLQHAQRWQSGYTPSAPWSLVELRARSDYALRWRIVEDDLVNEVAASADGTRIATEGAEHTRVRRSADGALLYELAGHAYAITFDDHGGLVRALRDDSGHTVVELSDPDGAPVVRVQVRGTAPTTMHAMHTDGRCETIYMHASAGVTSLASAGGVLAIGTSEGDVRLLRVQPSDSAERRLSRTDTPELPGTAVSAVFLAFRDPGELVAVYSDGAIVRWDVTRGTRRGTVPGACTDAELQRTAVIEGLPGDVAECGATLRAVMAGEHVVLSGSSGARVRTLGGARLAGFPSLHMNGIDVFGDELRLAGTGPVIERWSLDGQFRGVFRVGTAWSRIVAIGPADVAVMGAREGEVHGAETDGAVPTVLWEVATGRRRAGFDDVRGEVRFAGALAVVGLDGGHVAVRRLSDGHTVQRFEAPAAIGAAFEHATVIARGRVFHVSESVVDLGPAPPSPPEGTVVNAWLASADGSRIARHLFTASPFGFRFEVWSTGPAPRLLSSRDAVSESVSLSRDGARAVVTTGGPLELFDTATGAALPVPDVRASWVGFGADGRVYLQTRELGTPLQALDGDVLVTAGPTVLSARQVEVVGRRVAVFDGAGAHLLDRAGHVLAHLGAVAHDGFAITTPDGAFVASAGLHDELFTRGEDGLARTVDPARATPEVWRAVVR